jgi:hypothetical protein
MKRVLFVVLALLMAFSFVACNPSQMALWEKQKDTGYNGGVVRNIKVYTSIDGKLLWEKTGKCFIADSSTSGDVMILFTNENKKVDIIGPAIVVAEEIVQ